VSLKAITWAWEQREIASSQKIVLLALADHARECGCCFPSTKFIAEKCGMKQRMAQYHVKNLEKLGYLTRVKSKAKRLKTDGFKLLLDNPKECSATGCVIGVHPIAPTISISKDIDIKKRKIETTATAPEWLSLVDNDGTLVNNVSHPKIQEYVSDIESDYVGVDLVAEAKKYKLWWEGKKAKKPKLAFRNWLEKAKENYGESKRRVSKGIATEVSTTIDERTRELSERQRKSKSR
jgi:hypothetical protein|tara:strand:+ start:10044 stop:10751 length:708 start_codon:yes stop_codon:yes gene_type:complete